MDLDPALFGLVFCFTLTLKVSGKHGLVVHSLESKLIKWGRFHRGLVIQRNFKYLKVQVSIIPQGRRTLTLPWRCSWDVSSDKEGKDIFDILLKKIETNTGELFEFILVPTFGRMVWPTTRSTKLNSNEMRDEAVFFMTSLAVGLKMDQFS